MESGGSDVRRRILRAATEVFADKGYAGASIADISSAARVTKPMLYYYFGDKAGLFDAVIEQVHGRLKQGLSSRIRDERCAIDQLADIAELVFEATREQPTVSRLQFAAFFGTSTGAAREILMACAYLVYESILEVVQLGLRRGELCGNAGARRHQHACHVELQRRQRAPAGAWRRSTHHLAARARHRANG